ncbi:methyltransferase [Actinomycetia phage DSL-LC01]|nr:methyltransferase [Actinomycetia phage DSL-LC01]
MTYNFTDCNGLAAFMSLGFVEAGMSMQLRTGTLNFGNPVAELNRKHLGNEWEAFFSDDPNEWPAKKADAIVGCPPCSGWSVWSGPMNRGLDAPAHEHTRAFMKYAARVKPSMIVFECVQQAYTQGRDAMVVYRNMVEELSGKKYDLYHVKMNNLQVGGFSYRPRYFWVATRKGLKFGAQVTAPKEMPTIMDIIGDLEDLEVTWDAQKIKTKANKYVKDLRRQNNMVDGHFAKQNLHAQRIAEVFDVLGNDGWEGRENLSVALRNAVKKNKGKFTQSWKGLEKKIKENDYDLGFSQPARWAADSWCNVLTGSCLDHVVHPTQPRLITHREAARMQGLPDDWEFVDAKSYSALQSIWGKAVARQAGRWIGDAAVASLEGQPNGPQGELIGDREWLIDTDKGFSRQFVRKQWYDNKK